MSRHRQAPKRESAVDAVYGNKLAGHFINKLMKNGKKSVAEGVFHTSLNIIREKTNQDPLEIFDKALKNVRPLLEVKSRRVGGATYQVPIEVKRERGTTLAIKWIIGNSQAKKGRPMSEKLAQELMDAASGMGVSIKKREDTHRMAEANKAFSHFRW